MFQDIPSKKIFFKNFLTDRKNSSPNHVVYWWWNFSISQKNFEKFFFAWNVLKHKVKPKNSRNSTFFKELKFPPYFWKTLVKFSSPKCSLWYAVIFLSPREGKFKQNNNQLPPPFLKNTCKIFKSQGGSFNLFPWKSAFFRLMAESR